MSLGMYENILSIVLYKYVNAFLILLLLFVNKESLLGFPNEEAKKLNFIKSK